MVCLPPMGMADDGAGPLSLAAELQHHASKHPEHPGCRRMSHDKNSLKQEYVRIIQDPF